MGMSIPRWVRQVSPPAWLGVIGMLLIGLTLLGTCFRPPPGGDPAPDNWALSAVTLLLCIGGLLYLWAVAIVLKHGGLRHRTLWWILGCALVMRLILLVTPPFLSTDIYRYVWDGRVQEAGINPYRYVPADPALASLRDPEIYPWINFADSETTPYPPVAEGLFRLVAATVPTLLGMKAAMVALEAVAVGVLLLLLARAGLPLTYILIYAWHPVPLWELAGNGHVDAAAVAFIALALLARGTDRPAWTGVALGCATLAKLWPVVLLPALWRRWDWKLPAALLATLAVGYLPYLDVGAGVLGSLHDHIEGEGLIRGDGYYPLYLLSELVTLPRLATAIYVGGGLAVLAFLALKTIRRERPPGEAGMPAVYGDCLLLATGLIVFLTPTHPWYFVWLVLFSCLVPRPSVLALTALSPLAYFSFSDAGENAELIMYGVFWACIGVAAWRRARSAGRPAFATVEPDEIGGLQPSLPPSSSG